MEPYDVVIIGAGAAGLMASLSATIQGARVLLLEKNNMPGKKLLATGNGHCNFTNREMTIDCYHGNRFAWDIINEFNVDETLQLFKSIGVFPYEKKGYYYPASGQASSVLALMLNEIERTELCDIWVHCKVNNIQKEGALFKIDICKSIFKNVSEKIKKNGRVKQKYNDIEVKDLCVLGKTIIIAGGGMASPNLGSDGNAYSLAKMIGHRIIKPLPVLTGIVCKEKWFKEMAGVRVRAEVCAYIDGEMADSAEGELQVAANGISGIPVFQISHTVAIALEQKRSVKVRIRLFPEIDEDVIQNYFESLSTDEYIGLIPDKMLKVMLQLNGKKSKFDRVIWCNPSEMNSFERAQVTYGGVDVSEINGESLESKKCSKVFFAGEIMNVDGICGGYNLQWAWSSGFIAGRSAASQAQA